MFFRGIFFSKTLLEKREKAGMRRAAESESSEQKTSCRKIRKDASRPQMPSSFVAEPALPDPVSGQSEGWLKLFKIRRVGSFDDAMAASGHCIQHFKGPTISNNPNLFVPNPSTFAVRCNPTERPIIPSGRFFA
ncbi:MAG: hypothetical protein ACD_28C00194G0002 [uncultured bacterium]|nr:MAG: hypothetical protein ACD_28C00194G0002 [uncultured bacterium]